MKILSSLIALALLVSLVLVFFVAPNFFRQGIEEFVFENSGLQLTIAGDVGLTLGPQVGFNLNDVRLRNPDTPRELASAARVSLHANLWLLLRGQVALQEITVSGMQLNWHTDSEGIPLWRTEQMGRHIELLSSGDTDLNQLLVPTSRVSSNINLITISDTRIDIQNLQTQRDTTVHRFHLTSRGGNVDNRPFALELGFDLDNPNNSAPIPLTISSKPRINFDAGEVSLQDLQVSLSPVLMQGEITLSNIRNGLSWNGSMQSNRFPIRDLLGNLDLIGTEDDFLSVPGSATADSQLAQLRVVFSGDQQQMQIPSLQVSLGAMQLDAETRVRFADTFSPANISYSVRTNALDFSEFSATENSAIAADELTTAVTDVDAEVEAIDDSNAVSVSLPPPAPVQPQRNFEIPRNLFSNTNIQGSIAVDSLRLRDAQFSKINAFTNLEDAVLDIEFEPAGFREGTVQGNVRLDASATEIAVQSRLSASSINMVDMELPLLDPNTLQGRLTLDAQINAQGNSLRRWLDTLRGTAAFTVADSTVDVGVIRQVLSSIAALSPGGMINQQWADEMRFADLGGYVLFDRSRNPTQQLHVRLDNLDITGAGEIDLGARSFNYNVLLSVLGDPFVQTMQINPTYLNVFWPVQCGATFNTDAGQICRPDFPQVRQLFTQLASNPIPRAVEESAFYSFPEEVPQSSRNLLQNLFPSPAPVFDPARDPDSDSVPVPATDDF